MKEMKLAGEEIKESKISFSEKAAYAGINIGNIPIMTLINGYLLIFYTNVCGLDPKACATMFLIARILDGLNDPIVGFCIDRLPSTRFGHFRMPLIVGTILCSLNYLLLWFGPMLATSGKLVIAYISYLLIGVLFPIMDISLNSLLPVMTTDMKERQTLSAIKGFVYAAGGVVLGIAAPLILGDASNKAGYIALILGSTVIIVAFSIFGTLGVKERVLKPAGKEASYTFKELITILTQRPVFVTFLAIMLFSIGNNIQSTIASYFFTYIIGDLKLSSVASFLMFLGLLMATIFSGKAVDKKGKKFVFLFGFVVAAFAFLIRLISPTNIPLLMFSSVIMGAGAGFISTLNYSIQADNTDYIELKLGKRAEAGISALSSFSSKFAAGVGGAIPGYLLGFAGFNGKSMVQPEMVNTVIVICQIIFPMVIFLLGILVFAKGYPVTRAMLDEQNRILNERRKK